MSLLPSRPVTFGRSQQQPHQFVQQQLAAQAQAQLQAQQRKQQEQEQQAAQSILALPTGPGISLPGSSALSLPGGYVPPQLNYPPKTQPTNAVAGPSSTSSSTTPPATTAPATAATAVPLTLEQQHITAVEGIIPTLQNIVATVNLDCRLDLKTIALHARNAEYNPKVSTVPFIL